MFKSVSLSILFHSIMIILTALSLPFIKKNPISIPPIIAIDLIQISDKTQLPFAPKAREIIEKIKEKKKDRVVTKQAPPKITPKEKPKTVPLPKDLKIEKKKEKKKKQNPKEVKELNRQSSEFEKKEYLIPIKLQRLLISLRKRLLKLKKNKVWS